MVGTCHRVIFGCIFAVYGCLDGWLLLGNLIRVWEDFGVDESACWVIFFCCVGISCPAVYRIIWLDLQEVLHSLSLFYIDILLIV